MSHWSSEYQDRGQEQGMWESSIVFTSSPGELVSSLEGLLKSLFAKEALKFPLGLDLGTVSRLSFTASVSPCWKVQGWETIAEAFLLTSGSCRHCEQQQRQGEDERWKVPYGPDPSSIHSVSKDTVHIWLLQPATCWQHPERKRSSVSPYLSVFLFVQTEGKVWGEAEAGSCIAPVQPARATLAIVIQGRDTDFVEFSEWITGEQRNRQVKMHWP